jgi:cysteinyl-tRNA synthetase
MTTMRLHNTLTGRVEELRPLAPPRVGMYVCGLTVYSRGHVGNYRTFVGTDLLRRALKYKGYDVYGVMNITDVDDRIIDLASKAGVGLEEFTAAHIATYAEDRATLRIETPEVVPRATAHVKEMVDVISALTRNGHTYQAEGSVYFRIASFPEYGRLSGLDTAGMQDGARVDTDKYDKENPRDFVLWKLKSDEPAWAQWDAPFGKGRPGWHIECSAMAMKYLGETFDIHCGGVDLKFPHHENEVAQSECATKKPYVRHWVHTEHLLIEGETMSKSKGNVYNIPDLVARGHRPDAIRYLLSSAHYRKQLNFTWDGLSQAAASLDRIHSLVRRLGEVERPGPAGPATALAEDALRQFDAALSDDLNTPEALAAVHGLVNGANPLLASGELTREGAVVVRDAIARMDTVFAVLLPEAVDALSAEEQALFDGRQEARRKREFQKADDLRKALEAKGVVLEDTPKGTRWHRRS